ncbi:hypothetical protein [Bacillus pinisoli]|uniref:hypothetical protein n=1 Tax=Bacillus pinisoli TaxID=2901866 RepID=UPI001FF17346|nr:hypothetical protein [Bacillus pinisoli]
MITKLLKLSVASIILSTLVFNPFTIEAKKELSFDDKLEVFHHEYGLSQDFEKALKKLTNKYPEISIISYDENIIQTDTMQQEPDKGDYGTNSVSVGNLKWNDAILYDNDSQKYNYTGGWTWSSMSSSTPYDMVGVFPSDTSLMTLSPGTNLTLRGYNYSGTRTALWTTSGTTSGGVQLATTLNSKGVAFWIDDKEVKNGTISVHLGKTTRDPNARIQLQYNHSYTSKNVTGIGGSVSVKDGGGGFNVTWETQTVGQGPFYSPGAYIGDTTY